MARKIDADDAGSQVPDTSAPKVAATQQSDESTAR
jgi:hypothetical protein